MAIHAFFALCQSCTYWTARTLTVLLTPLRGVMVCGFNWESLYILHQNIKLYELTTLLSKVV